jgi:glycosyltransferase involved in cell wall biosynthesis
MLIRTLIEEFHVTIYAVHISENFTYVPEIPGLYTYKKSKFTVKEIIKKVDEVKPDLLYVAGYGIADFVKVAKQVKQRYKIPIIAGSDTQFRSTWKQRLLKTFLKSKIKNAFTHFWVAGPYQYEWARLLGFKKERIIFNLYSGNDKLFLSTPLHDVKKPYPKRLLFVGRFVKEKGIENLLKAWSQIENRNGWVLHFIGKGPLKELIESQPDVFVEDYLDQTEIVQRIQEAGAFILPSVFEPWGVVIHEFAMAGLPLLCSIQCGASPQFLINNYNGYAFDGLKTDEIKIAIEHLITLNKVKLCEMGFRSRELGKLITQQVSAYSLMSSINEV